MLRLLLTVTAASKILTELTFDVRSDCTGQDGAGQIHKLIYIYIYI